MTARLGGREVLRVHLWGGADLLDLLAGPNDGGTRLMRGLAERVADRFDGRFRIELTSSPRRGLTESEEPPELPAETDIVFLSAAPDVFDAGAADYTQGLRRASRALKELGVHVMVVNASTYDPTEVISNYRDRPEPFTRRAQRFNLAAMEVSIEEGISLIDVDRLVAELGGDSAVRGPLVYSDDASGVMCDEALRVIEDYGFFEVRPLIEQVGKDGVA